MNPADHRLERLLRSASQTSPEVGQTLPHYLEKSILSHWALMRLPVRGIWATEFFVPALAASAAVMVLVQLWNVWWPACEMSDSQFTLFAIYKIWNL